MKFTDGAWLIPPGVTPALAKRVIEHQHDGAALSLVVTDRAPGNRVDGSALQVRISSPMADVIRVQARHHWPADSPAAGFDLDYSLNNIDVEVEDTADTLHLKTGNLTVLIGKEPWLIRFETAGGQRVTEGLTGSLGYMEVADRGTFMMQRHHGGQWFNPKVDHITMPAYVRENSLLPTSSNGTAPTWKLADELTLGLYGLSDGQKLTAHITGVDGAADVMCSREGHHFTLGCTGAKRLRVHVPFGRVASVTNGRVLHHNKSSHIIEWIKPLKPLSMVVED